MKESLKHSLKPIMALSLLLLSCQSASTPSASSLSDMTSSSTDGEKVAEPSTAVSDSGDPSNLLFMNTNASSLKNENTPNITLKDIQTVVTEDEIAGASSGGVIDRISNQAVPADYGFGPYLLTIGTRKNLYNIAQNFRPKSSGDKLYTVIWMYDIRNRSWLPNTPFVTDQIESLSYTPTDVVYLIAFVSKGGGTISASFKESEITAGKGAVLVEWLSLADMSSTLPSFTKITKVRTTVNGVTEKYPTIHKTTSLSKPNDQVGARFIVPNVPAGVHQFQLEFMDSSNKVLYTLKNSRLWVQGNHLTTARALFDSRVGNRINGKLQIIYGGKVQNFDINSSFGGKTNILFKNKNELLSSLSHRFNYSIQDIGSVLNFATDGTLLPPAEHSIDLLDANQVFQDLPTELQKEGTEIAAILANPTANLPMPNEPELQIGAQVAEATILHDSQEDTDLFEFQSELSEASVEVDLGES